MADDAKLRIEEGTITKQELENNLSVFVKSFTDSGHARRLGVLLVKKVPSSRLRDPNAQIDRHHLVLSVSSCFTATENVPGIFSLSFQERNETIDWVQNCENQPGQRPVTLQKLLNKFRTGDYSGPQCVEIHAKQSSLRQALKIKKFAINNAPKDEFHDLCTNDGFPHILDSILNIATPGSPLPIRKSFARLTTIYYHHRGSARHWIVIPPREHKSFEDRIQKMFPDLCTPQSCSQIIRHLGLWIAPEALRRWNIEFYEVKQEALQMLFIFPDAYYYGYSTGFSIVERKSHALFTGELRNFDGYKSCDAGSHVCKGDPFNKNGIFAPVRWQPIPSPARPKMPQKRKRAETVAEEHREEQRHNRNSNSSTTSRVIRIAEELQGDGTSTVRGERNQHLQHAAPLCDTTGVVSISNNDHFDISDDEDLLPVGSGSSADDRVLQLRQEIADLRRDLAIVRAERDNSNVQKSRYKARLLEREALITSLQKQVSEIPRAIKESNKQVEMKFWEEMSSIIEDRKKRLAAANPASSGIGQHVCFGFH